MDWRSTVVTAGVICTGALLVVGCDRPGQPAGPVVATPPPPTAPAPPQTRTVMDEAHFASFANGDALDECTDFVVRYEVPPTADAAWAPMKRLGDTMGGHEGTVPIQRGCVEQFAGRRVLATCTASLIEVFHRSLAAKRSKAKARTKRREADAGREVGITDTFPFGPEAREATVSSRYYRYASTFEDQLFMRQCLEIGGDWRAVAEDSAEYRHARLEFHAGELRRTSEQAQRMLEGFQHR